MSKSLKAWSQETKHLDIKLSETDTEVAISLDYRMRAYTPRLEREVADAAGAGLESISWATAVQKLVVKWDLRLEPGDPIVKLKLDADPLTPEDEKAGKKPEEGPFLFDVPAELLLLVINSIGDDAKPDPK